MIEINSIPGKAILSFLLLSTSLCLNAQDNTERADTNSIFSVVQVLDEAVMTAGKNRMVYRIDKQRLSGSASLTAQGGTAMDVLRSIPSINVDAEGNVTFRGSSGFIVYIDGRQSPLEGTQALQQISASIIEDIEIITTPSARYKAEGEAGIINIITKLI